MQTVHDLLGLTNEQAPVADAVAGCEPDSFNILGFNTSTVNVMKNLLEQTKLMKADLLAKYGNPTSCEDARLKLEAISKARVEKEAYIATNPKDILVARMFITESGKVQTDVANWVTANCNKPSGGASTGNTGIVPPDKQGSGSGSGGSTGTPQSEAKKEAATSDDAAKATEAAEAAKKAKRKKLLLYGGVAAGVLGAGLLIWKLKK